MRPLAKKAADMIRAQGGQVIDLELIEKTLREIGMEYKPGLLQFIKGQEGQWARLLELEDGINKAALDQDEERLRTAVNKYKAFFLRMGEDFVSPQGNLFERERR